MKNLQSAVNDYLSIRRALGYKLEREGMLLPVFISFVERHRSPFITTELALKWAMLPENSSRQWQAKRLATVRLFARYVSAIDPRTEIPSPKLIPYRAQRARPYLYSDTEIKALLRACERLGGTFRPSTYSTLIGLLAVSGIRIGEAINLDCSDVDVHNSLLIIRNSKFGKSREVALHNTTIKTLCAYAKKREQLFPQAKCPSFFLSLAGTRLLSQNVRKTFSRLRQWAGLEHQHMPRIHDLRHTFAVKTLLAWYRNGDNVEVKLALLSTYMGHVSPSSTYWYLTASPDLLEIVAGHLETELGDLS